MNTQQEDLMEELANRDFIFAEETGPIVVYAKGTPEGSETVTLFGREHSALHERWNRNGMLVSAMRYNTDHGAETMRLLETCH